MYWTCCLLCETSHPQVLRDEGVVAPLSFHTQVYLNGQFYGLFGIIEEVRYKSCPILDI
jgi:hypothetical protein